MRRSRTCLATFGEALWDVLPKGIFLGGAPLNVAYHLSRHGAQVVPVTAVGTDFLGDEVVRRVSEWGIDPATVSQLRGRPTGTVRATLDARGNASYRFAANVAWDRIPVLPVLKRRATPAAVVYGTLALRSPSNRRALTHLFRAWPGALRVLDLNLRPPFDRAAAIDFALRQAHVLKLNEDELATLTGGGRGRGDLEQRARRLARRYHVPRVCVSAGSRGAGLLWHDTWHWEHGRPVQVRDTIGAGDAFLAAFLAALILREETPEQALIRACRMGEFVAGQDGATPEYRCEAGGTPRLRGETTASRVKGGDA